MRAMATKVKRQDKFTVQRETMEMAMMRMLKTTQGEREQKANSVPRTLLEVKSAKGVECVLQQERCTSDCFLAFCSGILLH